MLKRTILIMTLALVAFGSSFAMAGEGPQLMPRSMWMSGDPADLAPLVGSVWEFTTYMEGADPATETVIFRDSIRINQSTGVAVLGTMYPDCDPPPGPTGPLYEICGGTMYVQYGPGQIDLFGNLNEFGYGAFLMRPEGVYQWYWFNLYSNGLDEAALAIGYSALYIQGIFFPPTLLEGRRVFPEDDPPTEGEPVPEG